MFAKRNEEFDAFEGISLSKDGPMYKLLQGKMSLEGAAG